MENVATAPLGPIRNLRLKSVMRFDPTQGKFRIVRLMWERGNVGQPGGGYSGKLSLSLRTRFPFVGCSLRRSHGGYFE